jgi:SAM-dependent methyltransferase
VARNALKQRPQSSSTVLCGPFIILAATAGLFAAERAYSSYASVKPVLDAQREHLPAGLKDADEARWLAWSRREDKAIRGRLDQGDLDSTVNLLLYGTSFTKQPRIRMGALTEASRAGVLRARVDDLLTGLRNPGNNERLLFLRRLVLNHGLDPDSSGGAKETGVFLLNNLLRIVQERKTLAERAADAQDHARSDDPASLLDRSSLFRDRGLSLDSGVFPDFAIEQTLRDLKKRGVLREGQVDRVAVLGPGLDFIDKNDESAYDYYPPQTLQPFALYDSLVRLGLARENSLSISILDISARVIEHVEHARERARKNSGYVIQLPRDIARPWPQELIAYWRLFGDQAGNTIAPIRPPDIFPGLETRAVEISPNVVLACEPIDLDIILQHLNLAAPERFDLIVATNIFVYYDAFEQALALENTGAMLKPGGLLLTNDRLPADPVSSMRLLGVTVVPFDSPGVSAHEGVGWYQNNSRR